MMLHQNDNVHVSWDGSDDEKETNNSAFFFSSTCDCNAVQWKHRVFCFFCCTVLSQFSTYLMASVFLVLNERVTSNHWQTLQIGNMMMIFSE